MGSTSSTIPVVELCTTTTVAFVFFLAPRLLVGSTLEHGRIAAEELVLVTIVVASMG